MTKTKLRVRLYGDPCLRKKSDSIKEVGPAERMLIKQMLETMYESIGIGLAAPQVGINQQLFVADIGEGPFAVINPDIYKRSGSGVMKEGCLCLPGIEVSVRRSENISVRYIDENNREVDRECSGLLARVILHETDHLKGKVIVDYANFIEKIKLKGRLKELVAEKHALM